MYRRSGIVGVVLALIAMVAVPAAAGPGGTDRPFKAELVGELTFAMQTECPNPMGVLTKTEAWGNATHMGKVTTDGWAHCPTATGFLGDTFDLIAANGDLIHLWYEPVLEGNTFIVYVDGGTGRFAEATGQVQLTFGVEPQFFEGCGSTPDCYNPFVPWLWWGSMEGTISY